MAAWNIDWKRVFTGALTTEMDPEDQKRFNAYRKMGVIDKFRKEQKQEALRVD